MLLLVLVLRAEPQEREALAPFTGVKINRASDCSWLEKSKKGVWEKDTEHEKGSGFSWCTLAPEESLRGETEG